MDKIDLSKVGGDNTGEEILFVSALYLLFQLPTLVYESKF